MPQINSDFLKKELKDTLDRCRKLKGLTEYDKGVVKGTSTQAQNTLKKIAALEKCEHTYGSFCSESCNLGALCPHPHVAKCTKCFIEPELTS